MSTEAARVTVVQTEFERLQQYLAALPEAAWTTPSACALWAVRDVVAHLTRVANLYHDSITRGLQADTSTPAGRAEPNTFNTLSREQRKQSAMAAAQDNIAFGERVGTDLLAVFSHAWDQFTHLVAGVSPHAWDTPCYHPRSLLPVRALVHAGVFELAIHGWDIRSALEPSTHLAPEALAVMLDHFVACVHWCFLPDAKLPTPVRYRFALTGTLTSTWDIVVEGDTAHMAPTAEALPAHATFRCDGETFVLLLCGRVRLETAIGDRRVIPTGDEAWVRAFPTWFQGA